MKGLSQFIYQFINNSKLVLLKILLILSRTNKMLFVYRNTETLNIYSSSIYRYTYRRLKSEHKRSATLFLPISENS